MLSKGKPVLKLTFSVRCSTLDLMNIGCISYVQLKTWELAYAECPMLCNKPLSIKHVDYLSPQILPRFSLLFALTTYKLPIEQRLVLLSHLARAHCSLTVYPSAYTFLSLSIKLCR
jgi:hypothetical protein